ncbi:MAG: transglycosylase SLT domain-containing protein [Methylococcales bacterium]|nr:transglycosylase SLT domain-containing protein [Methylococcales bacterium]
MRKPKPAARRPAKTAGFGKLGGRLRKKRARKPAGSGFRLNVTLLFMEALGLIASAALASMLVLGNAARLFTGSDFFSNLLPFAIGVVALMAVAALLLLIWSKFRRWLRRRLAILPALLSIGLAAAMVEYVFNAGYTPVFTHFRALVGGKEQAAATTLSHQVYAAYRRYDEADLQKIMERSAQFDADIKDAALRFKLDPDILFGVAATESSFLPRDSKDGGHGLFQITAVPKFLLEQARQQLAAEKLSVFDSRHNAFIAAATLKHYLAEMNNDLFLGLLAYNIGPKNGGLKFIMEQYGATDFVTMQPYLQQLPRDYPIRVLSYSLAFRLWHQDGKLLAYQEGDNAAHIQRIGIPGLQAAL